GRVPRPRGPLLLGVRERGGGVALPLGRVRPRGRGRRRDPEAPAAVLQRRRLPSRSTVIEPPPPGPGEPPAAVSPRRGRRISIPGIVLGLAIVGSTIYIAYVVLKVEDNQIPLMAAGFVVLGASLAAVA